MRSGLKAQHHHDVAALDAIFKIGKNRNAHITNLCRQKRNRTNKPAIPHQACQEGGCWIACDTTVGDVATNSNFQTLNPTNSASNGCAASRRAWVGCSWRPSPALITAASTYWLGNKAAPEQLCRTTRMSGCIALSVVAVSSRVCLFLNG